MSDQKKQNENRRFIGKVKQEQGKYGQFLKIYIDNPYAQNEDGTPNKYYQGSLLWIDASGDVYLVKQLSVRGVPEGAKERGFVQSISVDLDNEYEVSKQQR